MTTTQGQQQTNGDDSQLTPQQMWDQELAAASGNTDAAATPAPTPAPAVQPAATPAASTPAPAAAAPAPAAATPADDPFAGLHPAVRARLESIDGLTQRLRNTEGHIGGLTSENKRLAGEVAAAQAAAKTSTAAPTTAQMQAAQASTAKWDQLKTEFPEWADALEERLSRVQPAQPNLDELRNQIRGELTQQLTTDITARVSADLAAKTEDRLVNVAHRGWKDTVKTKEFTDWYAKQPTEVQQLGASPVAEDAIALLDKYQVHRSAQAPAVDPAQVKQQRQQRLQEAASMARGNASVPPVKSPNDMTDQEYWDYAANQLMQQRQQQQGRR